MTAPKLWTKDEIKQNLQINDKWVLHGLLALYDRQTADEKATDSTRHHNKQGFSGADADFMSSLARQARSRGCLSPKQMVFARKKVMKYAGQLTKIANKQL